MIWKLDREHGTARPERPSEKLKALEIKLAPMLGTVAVAPDHFESYESGHSGRYGGNLDYHEIREGVTLYLPVLEAGALVFDVAAYIDIGDRYHEMRAGMVMAG